jgi:type II secretion system protein N
LNKKQYIVLYGAAFLWFLLLTLALLFLFFPYQRVFQFVFQNVVGGSEMTVSVIGARTGLMRIEASELRFGHSAMAGSPIAELEKARLRSGIASVLRGAVDVSAEAQAYGGKVNLEVGNIPVIDNNGDPTFSVAFSDINLSKYPTGRFPWFKDLKGTLSGRIKKDTSLFAKERQKGKFNLLIRDGEIGQMVVKNFAKLTVPFKTISAEGTIDGSRIDVTKILVDSDGIVLKGSGFIEGGGPGRSVDLKLSYEGVSKSSPLKGKGTIIVSGDLLSPEITLNQEGGASTGKTAAPSGK